MATNFQIVNNNVQNISYDSFFLCFQIVPVQNLRSGLLGQTSCAKQCTGKPYAKELMGDSRNLHPKSCFLMRKAKCKLINSMSIVPIFQFSMPYCAFIKLFN